MRFWNDVTDLRQCAVVRCVLPLARHTSRRLNEVLVLRPLSGAPNFAALTLAATLFWLISCLLLPAFNATLNATLLVFALTTSGLAVGLIAKRSPLMHGLLLGVLTGIVVAAFPALFQDAPLPDTSALGTAIEYTALAAIPGLAFCPLGALLAETLLSGARGR